MPPLFSPYPPQGPQPYQQPFHPQMVSNFKKKFESKSKTMFLHVLLCIGSNVSSWNSSSTATNNAIFDNSTTTIFNSIARATSTGRLNERKIKKIVNILFLFYSSSLKKKNSNFSKVLIQMEHLNMHRLNNFRWFH